MDKTLLIFLLALFFFASPLVYWWATPQMPWFLPYVLWGLLIALLIGCRRCRDAL